MCPAIMSAVSPAASDQENHSLKAAEAPAKMMDLSSLEIPSSERARRALRRQIRRELSSTEQELTCLTELSRKRADRRSSTKKLNDMIGRCLQRFNPFRGLRRLGAARFNHGVNPLRTPDTARGATLLVIGSSATLAVSAAVWAATHNLGLCLGGGLCASAGLFFGSWALRTAYDFCAGTLTLLLGLPYYAGVLWKDRKYPGRLRAGAFVKDLVASNLGPDEKDTLYVQRRELLKKHGSSLREFLETMESQSSNSADARESSKERALSQKAHIRERWLMGTEPKSTDKKNRSENAANSGSARS